jgi:hypothetical protein
MSTASNVLQTQQEQENAINFLENKYVYVHTTFQVPERSKSLEMDIVSTTSFLSSMGVNISMLDT